MIIHKTRKQLNFYFFLCLCFFTTPVFAQQLEPAPTFSLINGGYGAAALGMGGAFVALANDLSAIYWNPAGLAQQKGLQLFGDYRYQGDSDEDFSEEVGVNRFESQQRYAVSGNQLQAWAVSYSLGDKKMLWVPAFAWQRTSILGPDRALKETAGLVVFPTGETDFHFQSEGLFKEKFTSGQDEYSLALSAKVSSSLLIGGSWNFLTGGPKDELAGNFHDSLVQPSGSGREKIRTDIDLTQTRNEKQSGNYLKLALLFLPRGGISFGGYLRFPYTYTGNITLDKKGPFTITDTFLDANDEIIRVETSSGNLQERATARSQVHIPIEWSLGVAIRPRNSFLLSGSITHSDWTNVEQVISGSSDIVLLPETTLPYPTLRQGAGLQSALLQWRGGIEYLLGQQGNGGIAVRAGIFRDGQPLGNINSDRIYFKGYTFGAGFIIGGVRFDAALVREKGNIQFTPQSSNPSNFANRRYVFSLSYASH